MGKIKLEVGKRYNITFKWGVYKGLYYSGMCDSLGGQTCDCCDKKLENGHLFFEPFQEATYEECLEGRYSGQARLGTTCIKKVEITEWQPE